MPIVRFSGKILSKDDPNRKVRAKLLYRLFANGWDIYNGNGDQVITLKNIQRRIKEAGAFIFTPGAQVEDMFKAASIFVGYQTLDEDLKHKPTIIMNKDGSWDNFLALIEHLHRMGTVHQKPEDFFLMADRPKEVFHLLNDIDHSAIQNVEVLQHDEDDLLKQKEIKRTEEKKPPYNVCVFCSASSKNKEHLDAGFNLGKALAEEGWGCVSGAGKTGIMGQVVKGANDHGGWTGGSNVPRIIAMEGLPEGLDVLWPKADIYTRMEIMIDQSQAFAILPGGVGTLQELLVLIILKEQGHRLMKGKHIIVVNVKDKNGEGFWTPALRMIDACEINATYTEVETIDEVIPKLHELRKVK